jgi:hypothetical protein
MKKHLLPLLPMVLLLASSCGDDTTSGTATEMNNSQNQSPAQEPEKSEEEDELQDWSSLPADSIRILHGQVPYTIHGFRRDNDLIVEGDMTFEYPEIKGVGITRDLWPVENKAIVVKYALNANVDTAMQEKIKAAMAMWQKSIPVTFIPNAAGDKSFVEFMSSNDTRSSIGRLSKKQYIRIEPTRKAGSIAHEIGHALGLYHEQNRRDRNEFVRITGTCSTNANYRMAFTKDPRAEDIGSYDYYSLMHYGTRKGCMEPVKTDLPTGIPGQRKQVSPGDSLSIVTLYQLQSSE